ncbi:sugar kinase [Actinoplanes italicus]|uniref:Putative NBD/HSP70 family sugar kinase n=1 Tax=Actinoplanes italicus TaxID=113567 RepID=A0A2T0KC55_9ACTN|nr:ROK family transcriptional regulator [Actinoplanes italicus]PRX20824.1 putative NBD/HSP70 family sugar kinase [Actinoplanes italicus]GIE31300.1 sugar kinase [Actinoplanes italicus]
MSARARILDAIRAGEPVSRVELARRTGLTEAAVSTTVRKLLDEGLVLETGRSPSGGKPRTLLRLDPAARVAVGIHHDGDRIIYVLTGQTGGVLARLATPAVSPSYAAGPLADGVERLLSVAGVDRDRCLGVGVATADGPPPDEIAGFPVLSQDQATAAAVGAYWVERVEPERPFAALYLGTAFGAGVVLDGRARPAGFGHVCVLVDGPECWCGGRGCLEAVAGPRTVITSGGPAGFDAVARQARSAPGPCREALEASAGYVAAAAETVVNLFGVNLLVLTGPGFAAASFVYGPAIARRIRAADARTWKRSVTVTVSPAATIAAATGAAALILQSHLTR